jgi:urea-proton symporter
MGLSALALELTPVFPGFPLRMSNADVSAGLVLPNAAVALLGKGGAGASFLLVFMAVTSAMSAELIAVSSIFTYDIYQTYFHPQASGRFLIRMSHASCIGYAIIMAGFSTGLFYAGISMGYIYLMMGCIISSAVLPATLTLMWKDMNWIAAAASPPLGLMVALIAWLVTAKKTCGALDVVCTGSNYPMLAGNVAALLSPCVFIPILTFGFGKQNYDWVSMKEIRKGDDHDLAAKAGMDLEQLPGERRQSVVEAEAENMKLNKAFKIASSLTVFMTLALLILWPMPMYGSGYIFSKKFFTGWVAVGILWLFCSSFAVGIFPVWQGRKTIAHTFKCMYLDATGKWKPTIHGNAVAVEDESKGSATPTNEATEEKMAIKSG